MKSPSRQDGGKAVPPRRGSFGPRAIGAAVARVARPVLGKRGFAEAAIITDWPSLVGPQLAAHTLPTRVAHARGQREGGVLHLRVAGGAFATEVQHLEPLILERINRYFGYRAIARIKLSQGPLPRRRSPKLDAPRPLAPSEEQALAADVAGIASDDLREALARLGRAVMGRTEPSL
ncbi:MAG: DciA family protein [Alphaproteobacteria bacterium]